MAGSEADRLQAALGDHYTIERQIGAGGMATVYLAADRKHHRPVAIKVFRPELAAVVGSDRFLREIDIAAGLTHPHILSLYDSGEADGLLYYVMPYVEGETLRDRLVREGPLPVDDALGITREVADALSYAHSHDVVHRDIKPENILLSGGHAYVADFGIARAVSAAYSTDMTPSGIAVGTPPYMSPEQASGSGRLDGRSDQYSLGCVLYEMLTGEPPYTGATAEAVHARRMSEPPRPIRTVRPSVSPALEQMVMRLLARAPADRFTTTSQVVAALPQPSGAGPLLPLHGRRARLGLALAAAAVMVAVGLWIVLKPAAPHSNPQWVVVFPLAVSDAAARQAGLGQDVATLLVAALDETERLRGLEGIRYVESANGQDADRLPPDRMKRIARAAGARYYTGASLVATDSQRVLLELYDVVADSGQRLTLAMPLRSDAQAVALAVARVLLRRLVPAVTEAEMSALAGRRPDAVYYFLRGQEAYRRASFDTAYAYMSKAVARDSAFALAALRGAQAALWKLWYDSTVLLTDVALAHRDELGPWYVHFAAGLRAYATGRGDSAVSELQEALRLDPNWTEARMALGEAYYHLLPRAAPLDSLAQAVFEEVHRRDPAFVPVYDHLVEIYLRGGEVRRAEPLLVRFRTSRPDSQLVAPLQLALECVAGSPQDVRWQRHSSQTAIQAARVLTVGGLRQPGCAEAAWQAFLAADTAPAARLGALRGLQAVLVAQGRFAEALSLLRSEDAPYPSLSAELLILDLLAGAPFDAQADRYADTLRLGQRDNADIPSEQVFTLAQWDALHGDARRVRAAADLLAARHTFQGDDRDSVLAEALRARLTLLAGDTSAAIRALARLTPVATKAALTWDTWSGLPAERLLLARLALARGRPRVALAAASGFDATSALSYAAFVPASLRIRIEAARALGESDLARRLEARLASLQPQARR